MSSREVVRRCEGRFEIQVIEPLAHEGGAQVFLATSANEELVLKIGVNAQEVIREVHALSAFANRGAIRVMDYDGSLPALLLQRAVPGNPLSDVFDDVRATAIFCSVFHRLQPSPVVGTHESIQDHVSEIGRYQCTAAGAGPLPVPWLDRALDYLDGLIASTDRPVYCTAICTTPIYCVITTNGSSLTPRGSSATTTLR